MLKLIEDFPDHIIQGKNIANASNLTKPKDEIQTLFCGMGLVLEEKLFQMFYFKKQDAQ